VAVLSIGNHPTDGRKEETRKTLKESGNPHQKRGIGQLQNQPADSHQLHVIPDMGKHPADPEQAEIPVLKCAETPVALLYRAALSIRKASFIQ